MEEDELADEEEEFSAGLLPLFSPEAEEVFLLLPPFEA
jgi:hypothetical protein